MVIIIIIAVVIAKKRETTDRNKPQDRQVMRNTMAHHPLTQLIPEQQSEPPGQLPPVSALSMTCCGMEYPFG